MARSKLFFGFFFFPRRSLWPPVSPEKLVFNRLGGPVGECPSPADDKLPRLYHPRFRRWGGGNPAILDQITRQV